MFQTASTIQKIETMVDGSIKLTIYTQELKPDQATELFKLKQKLGYFLFKETAIKEDEIDVPDFVPEIKGDKTPSQRLRATLYVLWQQKGKQGTADDFYKQQMERFIEAVKERLN